MLQPWVYAAEDLTTFIPRFYLLMFAYAILWNELRLVTGSVWPAILIHCQTNKVQHPLAADYLKIVPGMEYLGAVNGYFMLALIGILGIAPNQWRTHRSSKVLAAQSIGG